ncbi:DUF6223 family protein [Streptomyces sp. NPDC101117]|uniref:DUF6223 family protein n=1 Tax=Streptomyces sp. NPDC101117 TaxID=3366108 RepID=UPI0037FBE14F
MAIGWLFLARIAGRISIGNPHRRLVGPGGGRGRHGPRSAAPGHLQRRSPGTGNGTVGAVAATPLGLIAMVLGRRALARSRHTGQNADHIGHEREFDSTS